MKAVQHAANENLGEFVAREARSASDGVLVGTGVVGVLVVAGALEWRPPAWPVFAAAGLMLLALAAWGALDRELYERSLSGRWTTRRLLLLRGARAVIASIGWMTMIAVMFGLVGVFLGTVKS